MDTSSLLHPSGTSRWRSSGRVQGAPAGREGRLPAPQVVRLQPAQVRPLCGRRQHLLLPVGRGGAGAPQTRPCSQHCRLSPGGMVRSQRTGHCHIITGVLLTSESRACASRRGTRVPQDQPAAAAAAAAGLRSGPPGMWAAPCGANTEAGGSMSGWWWWEEVSSIVLGTKGAAPGVSLLVSAGNSTSAGASRTAATAAAGATARAALPSRATCVRGGVGNAHARHVLARTADGSAI